jgi:hypothetical protein
LRADGTQDDYRAHVLREMPEIKRSVEEFASKQGLKL